MSLSSITCLTPSDIRFCIDPRNGEVLLTSSRDFILFSDVLQSIRVCDALSQWGETSVVKLYQSPFDRTSENSLYIDDHLGIEHNFIFH